MLKCSATWRCRCPLETHIHTCPTRARAAQWAVSCSSVCVCVCPPVATARHTRAHRAASDWRRLGMDGGCLLSAGALSADSARGLGRGTSTAAAESEPRMLRDSLMKGRGCHKRYAAGCQRCTNGIAHRWARLCSAAGYGRLDRCSLAPAPPPYRPVGTLPSTRSLIRRGSHRL